MTSKYEISNEERWSVRTVLELAKGNAIEKKDAREDQDLFKEYLWQQHALLIFAHLMDFMGFLQDPDSMVPGPTLVREPNSQEEEPSEHV